MTADRPRILFVTDFSYPAQGRRYGDEDIFLTSQLRDDFVVATCHPSDASHLMRAYDLVVVRNSGPVIHYQSHYDEFRRAALASGVPVYNELTGRGDMAGKGYLVDLFAAGFPVIPTVSDISHLALLPDADEYVVKPVLGADSVGLRFVDRREVIHIDVQDVLIQPRVEFSYEVSFYFVDQDFQYALHAPDPERRWALEPYVPSAVDLEFAQRFVVWNTITRGIQRVDACRTPEGRLLLVELEDLNPYLSLDLVDPDTRVRFVGAMRASMRGALQDRPPSASVDS